MIGRPGPGRRAAAPLCGAAVVLGGCAGVQSTLAPAGPQAEAVAALWWAMLAAAAAVVAVVVALLLVGTRRPRAGAGGPSAAGERARARAVAAGALATLAVLVATLTASLLVGRALPAAPAAAPVQVEVTGRRFWWEVRYLDARGETLFTTANEIHLPVGAEVPVRVRTGDVIHSFWVPPLAGKIDMIPGRANRLVLRADEPGLYRGQCAEFCGLQHALMGLLVVAEPPHRFAAWLREQARPAPRPAEPDALLGLAVFLDAGCGDCHAVRGTRAVGTLGPDLTHLASRRTLAAAVLPNTRGHLAGWIADPQRLKPGSNMPRVPLTGEQMTALLTYLETLR